MTVGEKNRLIELLIKEVDATGEAEGIWFGDPKDSIELCELLIKYNSKPHERLECIKRLQITNG